LRPSFRHRFLPPSATRAWLLSAPSAGVARPGDKGPKSPVMRNLLRKPCLRPKLVPFVDHTDARSPRVVGTRLLHRKRIPQSHVNRLPTKLLHLCRTALDDEADGLPAGNHAIAGWAATPRC